MSVPLILSRPISVLFKCRKTRLSFRNWGAEGKKKGGGGVRERKRNLTETMGLSLSHHYALSSQSGAPFLTCALRQLSCN